MVTGPALPAPTGPAHVPVDGPPVDGAGLSTGGVARRLGVSPTTVRSWERRYGIGPAGHETGRHRRWSPADVAVLEAMCALTARGVPPAEAARAALSAGPAGTAAEAPAGPDGPPATARPGGAAPGGRNLLPLGPVRPECRGLARAAVRLDAPAVERMLARTVADFGPVAAWEEVMVPALRAVGRKWAAEGERYVEVEHLLSWHVSSALRAVATSPVAVAGAALPVLLAGMPNEQHSLPLDALAAGLSGRGLPYRMFGPAVPPPALLAAVARTGPSAVVLWAQSRATADRRLALEAATTAWGVRGARSRPAVVLAGPGWAGAPRTAGTLRPRGLSQALDQLAMLAGH
ncbi:MerR family transcriptional regulator [Kitasatospora sp. NPDC059571]|uniref:MerR family transcriptional regulator n=1 Tax=Kitasatospora sp. NPDC059571 TaxID=3346871 RepID=UPI003696D2DC